MTDPKMRRDGKCVQCRGVRRTKQKQEAMRIAAVDDPFCSSECCRAYYQVEISPRFDNPGIGHNAAPRGTSVQHGTRKGYRLCACPACAAAARMLV